MRSADTKEARFAEAHPPLQDKWDLHFMCLAYEASLMSKDPSTRVGSVLVKDRRVVGTGFNGFPAGIKDDRRLHDREVKYKIILHSEVNALLQAGREAKDSTLYVYGFSSAPCTRCTAQLIQAGVSRVVAYGGSVPDRWKDDFDMAEGLLREAGVELNIHPSLIPPQMLRPLRLL